MSLSQCHFDKPISHTSTRTRWLLPTNAHIYAPSLKIFDINVVPNNPAYFTALTGCYSLIKRIQVLMGGKEVDVWTAKSALPYLLAATGDNEEQFGINSVLHLTGNNVKYDSNTKLLTLDRPLVGSRTCTIDLNILSGLIDAIGIIDSQVEIIVDWETNGTKVFCPAGSATPSAYTMDPPYITYETVNMNIPQPNNVEYTMYVEDQWVIPAIPGLTGSQEYVVRSNAFNQKSLGRLLLSNLPSSVNNGAPSSDLTALYSLFGPYMSVPQKAELFNVSKEGQNLLTFRNSLNDATKLSIVHDAFGPAVFVTNGHTHTKNPVLKELSGLTNQLNGFCSYGGLVINSKINKELALTYRRTADSYTNYPSLADALILNAVAEVRCVLVNGEKQYI